MAGKKTINGHVIHAGELRWRCNLLRQTTTIEHGISKNTWSIFDTVWCNLSPISSNHEYWLAAAENRQDEVRFTIRYRPDITSDMHIQCEGKEYEITGIMDAENRHTKLNLLARRVDDQ